MEEIYENIINVLICLHNECKKHKNENNMKDYNIKAHGIQKLLNKVINDFVDGEKVMIRIGH
jgi:hypothetical protein